MKKLQFFLLVTSINVHASNVINLEAGNTVKFKAGETTTVSCEMKHNTSLYFRCKIAIGGYFSDYITGEGFTREEAIKNIEYYCKILRELDPRITEQEVHWCLLLAPTTMCSIEKIEF